jgi:hypothetical protein
LLGAFRQKSETDIAPAAELPKSVAAVPQTEALRYGGEQPGCWNKSTAQCREERYSQSFSLEVCSIFSWTLISLDGNFRLSVIPAFMAST